MRISDWSSDVCSSDLYAGFDRSPEFRLVDRHEIDELARAREPERFDCEDPRRLRQRLDDEDAGHDRPAGEMPREEALVDRHRLDRRDPLIGDDLLDPVDEQHRIAIDRKSTRLNSS